MHTELESPAAPTTNEHRHSRKCTICNHPDREAIDEAFLHWSRGERIVQDFNLPSLSCLYRHAHARGLWTLRRSNIRHALDRIIEQAGECRATANAIIRAIEISCRFDQDGHYTEPKKKVIVEHHTVTTAPNPNRESNQPTRPTTTVTPTKQTNAPNQEPNSNRESLRLENPVTPTKQSPDPNPNREKVALFEAPPITTLTAAEIQNMLIGRP
jgi:hypothetical protein